MTSIKTNQISRAGLINFFQVSKSILHSKSRWHRGFIGDRKHLLLPLRRWCFVWLHKVKFEWGGVSCGLRHISSTRIICVGYNISVAKLLFFSLAIFSFNLCVRRANFNKTCGIWRSGDERWQHCQWSKKIERKMKKKYETLRTVIATMNVLHFSLPQRNAKLMWSVRSLISLQLITHIAPSTLDSVRSAFVVQNVADESWYTQLCTNQWFGKLRLIDAYHFSHSVFARHHIFIFWLVRLGCSFAHTFNLETCQFLVRHAQSRQIRIEAHLLR